MPDKQFDTVVEWLNRADDPQKYGEPVYKGFRIREAVGQPVFDSAEPYEVVCDGSDHVLLALYARPRVRLAYIYRDFETAAAGKKLSWVRAEDVLSYLSKPESLIRLLEIQLQGFRKEVDLSKTRVGSLKYAQTLASDIDEILAQYDRPELKTETLRTRLLAEVRDRLANRVAAAEKLAAVATEKLKLVTGKDP